MKIFLVYSVVFFLSIATGTAQTTTDKYAPKYMRYAIPEVEGKVVFSTTAQVDGVSTEELYNRLLKWTEEKLIARSPEKSRILYTSRNEIVAGIEELLTFSTSALSVDRTRIYFHYHIKVEGNSYTATINRIRYWYNENRDGGEKFTAEEWITDKVAMNKAGTRLYPAMGKFRRKTIDLKDELFQNMIEYVAPAYSRTIVYATQPAPTEVAPAPVTPAVEKKETIRHTEILSLPIDTADKVLRASISIEAGEETLMLKPENWRGMTSIPGKTFAYIVVNEKQRALKTLLCESASYFFHIAEGEKTMHLQGGNTQEIRKLSTEELQKMGISATNTDVYRLYISEISTITEERK